MGCNTKQIAVVFYLSKDIEGSLEDLAKKAGCEALEKNDTLQSGYFDCFWGSLTSDVWLLEKKYHRVVRINFSLNQYLNLSADDNFMVESLEDSGALPIVNAFRDASERLHPEAAMFLNSYDQAELDWLEENEWMVSAEEADELLDLHLAMLFLNEDILKFATTHPVRDDRDTLEMSTGKLFFSRSGKLRLLGG